jgi:hypothetical protein
LAFKNIKMHTTAFVPETTILYWVGWGLGGGVAHRFGHGAVLVDQIGGLA